MQKIDWEKFKQKNPNYREAFEELCYHLFCRRYKLTEGVRVDFNQVGLETHPINIGGEIIGFQAKFFDNELSSRTSVNQINDSIFKAKNKYRNLRRIIIYTHKSFGSANPQYKKEIEKKAGTLEVEWIVNKNFDIIVNQPSNLDLAQFYFGYGDELGFIQGSIDKKQSTLINSSEYAELLLEKDGVRKIDEVVKEKGKVIMLLGNPGSGKSVLIYKLFQITGGLDRKTIKGMQSYLSKSKALPMLVNLKDCAGDTLENLIRNRRSEYKLDKGAGTTYKIIYLFDGLDELDEQTADQILSYVVSLTDDKDTAKIIFSCRSGNLNRLKAKEYLSPSEYEIKDLSQKQLDDYFRAKNDPERLKKLKGFRKTNLSLIEGVNDIFMAKLLWDTIDELDSESSSIDLLDRKINLLLTDSRHKKNLDKLNLLNPKNDSICNLNQELSLQFQKSFQFRIKNKELQELVLSELPRVDYASINDIVNYLADLFFDGGPSGGGKGSYAYQHRRYQEFFFTKKLKELYERDVATLREFNVLSNHDFFYDLFLKYLKKEYLRSRNLPRLLELNLINAYAGKHRGWGADDPYYVNSSEFIPALACQKSVYLEQLFEDDNLELRAKILFDINNIKQEFNKWKTDQKNWRVNDYLKSVWGSGVAELINHLRTFHSYNKNSFVEDIRDNLQAIHNIYKKEQFLKKLDPKDVNKPADPYWQSIESWIYFRIAVKKDKIDKVLDSLVRANYKYLSEEKQFATQESGKEKIVKAFFRVCLEKRPRALSSILNTLDEYEWLALLEVVLDFDLIPLFFSNTGLNRQIKSFISTYSKQTTEVTYFIPFYKKLFGIVLNDFDNIFVEEQLDKYRKERHFEWRMYNIPFKYSLLVYARGESDFGHIRFENTSNFPNYYNELQLYSLVFDGYLQLLQRLQTTASLVRDYKKYIVSKEVVGQGLYLKTEMSFLWSYVFKYSNLQVDKLRVIKTNLFKEENNVYLFSFYLKLKSIDSSLFNQLVNESELEKFEEDLKDWQDDYPSYIDRCFQLGQFYADINPDRAVFYVSKGINDGILRHGWRKDPIIAYHLVDALEILWRNNFVDEKSLVKWSEKVFQLTLRAKDITDGAVTSRGPYNMIRLISRYNLSLAEKLKDQLIEHSGYHNFSNTVITDVLLAKVDLGINLEELEALTQEYRRGYDYEGKPDRDYYEEKLRVYIAVAKSDAYSKNDQEVAFEKGYELVDKAINEEVKYFLNMDDNKDERTAYAALCKRFKKRSNLPKFIDRKDEYKRPKGISESGFVKLVKNAKTKKQIASLMDDLKSYEKGVVLKNKTSWNLIVKKTYKVTGSISLITNFLRDQSYPHTDFYSAHSKYLHFCVAAALEDISMKDEMLDYLFENGGHEGFTNIMKSYEVIGDKSMCVELFEHFYKFCKFLVY